MNEKQIYVIFGSKKLESSFESLKKGKFQDKQLYDSIEKAIKNLKNNPSCGIKIPKKLWPKIYMKKYSTTNLWKYDLPNGWRLVYTIKTDEIMILSVILEWFNHKEYEKRFKY
ncbi:MAG: type II toxin-antitoxin system RelE/ParE family toxin [Candidatus Nanoarchaeia archaeon]|nr:type II toxin-antitoxin system RelE/ParE family toxin [Candidatus Nanoarchaeia archaeon]